MKTEELIQKTTDWIRDYVATNGIRTLVVGVSGGIDSAVVFRLCVATGKEVIAIAMPMSLEEDSSPDSLKKAEELVEGIPNVTFAVRPIGEIVDAYSKALKLETYSPTLALLQGNVRSRIRANILYHYAGLHSGIVVGTGNKDEDEIGYFTKGGDGLVDICPLSLIHKSDVRKMAKLLDVPQSIIDAQPTAGLWDGQTDEDELGMTYDEVEWAIKHDELQEATGQFIPTQNGRQDFVLGKVRTMRARNAHKLKYPPVFDPGDEYKLPGMHDK
jgi:NAD+ synthase